MRASALASFGKVLLRLGQYCESVAILDEADIIYEVNTWQNQEVSGRRTDQANTPERKRYFGPTHSVRIGVLADKADAELLFALQQPFLVGNLRLFDVVRTVFGSTFTKTIADLQAASYKRMHSRNLKAKSSKPLQAEQAEYRRCCMHALRDYQQSFQVMARHSRITRHRRACARTRILLARSALGFFRHVDKQNILLALRKNRKEYEHCMCTKGLKAVDSIIAYVARVRV